MHENSLKARLASFVLRETESLFDHLATWSVSGCEEGDAFRSALRHLSGMPERTDKDIKAKTAALMRLLPCEEESYAMYESASMIRSVCCLIGDEVVDGSPDLLLANHDLLLFINAVALCAPNLEPSWAKDREKQERAHHWWTGEAL